MSSFYSDASLVMIPSGYKDAKVYSAKPVDGSGDLDFSRGSDIEATRVNANGYIEKAKVNLLTYSNDFSNVAWTRVGAAPTSGQSGYDGSSDAWLLSATGAGAHYALQSNADTAVSTFSVYAKQGTSKGIRIAINGGGDHWANFNLDLGTQIGTAASVVDTEITSVGGGWYRISVTANKTGIGWGVVYILDNSFNTSFTAAGETIYIQDAQLNYGLVAQTYQETTTAAVVSGITDNMPRLNYDPANPTCPSLLLEPSRQNLFTNDSYFGGSDWIKQDATITSNAAISPEGVQNASLYTSSTAPYDFVRQTISFTSGNTYTLSVFVKAGTSDQVDLGFQSAAFGTAGANFNLTTLAVTTFGTTTGKIDNYGNGWFRCSATATATATANATIGFSSAASGSVTTFYLYGAQLEIGSYESSLIPTYGSSATRTADACSKTSASALIGQTEGTIFWEVEFTTMVATGHEGVLNIDDGVFGNTIYLFKGATGTFVAEIYVTGVQQASFISSSQPIGTYKMALAYANNNTAFFLNGEQIGITDTSCNIPATNRIQLGNGALGPSTDFTKQLLLFPTRLSDADLATLTTL